MNKAINMQSTVDVGNEHVVYMSCQVGCAVDMLNLSIQVVNKELYDQNKDMVSEKCGEFIEEAFSEAVEQGWEMLDVNL